MISNNNNETGTKTKEIDEEKREREGAYLKHKINDEFQEWGNLTTFHGVPVIFRAPNLYLKLFWIALFLISSGLCCYMLAKTFIEYYQYKVSTTIRWNPKKSLPLPQVTICNEEFFVGKQGSDYVKEYFLNKFNLTVNDYSDLLNYFTNEDDLANELTWLKTSTYLLSLKNPSKVKSLGLSLDKMFLSIRLGDVFLTLNDSLVKWFFDPSLGNCFRINYKSVPAINIINVNTAVVFELFSGFSDDPTSISLAASKGFRIEVKLYDGYPFVFSSTYLDVGLNTNVLMSLKASKIVPKPYSNCVDLRTYSSTTYTQMKQLGIEYSREYCLDLYAQMMIFKNHGCYDPTLPHAIEVPPCNQSVSQTQLIKYRFYNVKNECPLECNSREYDMSTSSDEYPTRNYFKQLLAFRPAYFESAFNRSVDNISYEMVKKSFASLQIRYDKLSIRENSEQPAVPAMNLISNLGGLLGVFVGLSFLSFMEIFEFGFVTALLFYTIRFSKSKVVT